MATIQELIAASQAANPQAAGRAGTYFAPGGPATNNSIQVGGKPLDYSALVSGDPQLQQAQANARAQIAASAAARRAATAKILAQLGIAPDFTSAMGGLGLDSSYLNSDFGGTEKGLAQQMTEQGLSTTARLDNQHDTAVNSVVDLLASRGSLRSGGLGTGLSVENQRDKQAQFDALQQALASIGQVQGDYNQTVQSTTGDLQGAGAAAVQRQIALHPSSGGGGAIQAEYDETTGLYKTADGAFFNPDGSATQPGAVNARPVHPTNVAPGPTLNAAGMPPNTSYADLGAVPDPIGANPLLPTGPYTPTSQAGPYSAGPSTTPTQQLTAPQLPGFGAGTVTAATGQVPERTLQSAAVPKATIPAPSDTGVPGLPQAHSFGGNTGPYVGTMPQPAPVPQAQSGAFGGTHGPYIGTLNRLNMGR